MCRKTLYIRRPNYSIYLGVKILNFDIFRFLNELFLVRRSLWTFFFFGGGGGGWGMADIYFGGGGYAVDARAKPM